MGDFFECARFSFVLAFVILIGISLTSPMSAAAPSQQPLPHAWGMNFDDPSPDRSNAEFIKAQEAHIRWARITLFWRDLEHVQGVINWSPVDQQMAMAEKMGMRIFTTFAGIPYWANGTAIDCEFWNSQKFCSFFRFARPSIFSHTRSKI
jgi:hypothetical protein